MRNLTYYLLIILYLLDLTSTQYSMPDLKEEGYWLAKIYPMNMKTLWLLNIPLLFISLIITRYFFQYFERSKGFFHNFKDIFSEKFWISIFKQSILLFSFVHIFSTIIFKFLAIIWNFLFGIYKWKSFNSMPQLQNSLNKMYLNISEYDPVSLVYKTMYIFFDDLHLFVKIPYYMLFFSVVYFYIYYKKLN